MPRHGVRCSTRWRGSLTSRRAPEGRSPERNRPAGAGPGEVAEVATAGTSPEAPPSCLRCGMQDPPPEQTCENGMDHYAGRHRGCPVLRAAEGGVRPAPVPGESRRPGRVAPKNGAAGTLLSSPPLDRARRASDGTVPTLPPIHVGAVPATPCRAGTRRTIRGGAPGLALAGRGHPRPARPEPPTPPAERKACRMFPARQPMSAGMTSLPDRRTRPLRGRPGSSRPDPRGTPRSTGDDPG